MRGRARGNSAFAVQVACAWLATLAAGRPFTDFRDTYPDSCPLGVDRHGQPSRLCLPPWPPTYSMARSTIIMACNKTGWYDAEHAARYGVVDLDWSNAKQLWANAKPMDCEERLVTQASLIKARNPATHVWVYRNLVKALPWYSSVREKLCDPAYAGWFLKFDPAKTPHVPKCDDTYDPSKCSDSYHDQQQTPHHPYGDGSCAGPCDCGCVPCGEYLWDHRNESLRAWLAHAHATGSTSIGHPDIDGIFIDDQWSSPGGPGEEDMHAVEDMGLSVADVMAITGNWTLTMKAVHQAALDGGGFAWRLFSPGSNTKGSDPIGGQAGCARALRARCVHNDTLQHSALMMRVGSDADFAQNLAAFLLARGPYAWFGHGWEGCGTLPVRPAALDADYGEPLGHCAESAPGVFTRNWSKAVVSLDCNTWQGHILLAGAAAAAETLNI